MAPVINYQGRDMHTINLLPNHQRRQKYLRWLTIAVSVIVTIESTFGFAPLIVRATGGPDLTTCALYGYNDEGSSDSQFFRMNLQTGTVTDIGAVATDEDIEAIDTQPSTGTIYGFPDNGSDDSSAVLVTVDRDTGARTFVANVSNDFELPGASFNPVTGELWAGADTNDNLYTVNLATGVPTLKLDASKTGEPQALAWNNAGSLLYVAYGGSSGTKIYTTDGTSALTEVADLDDEVEAMEFDENGNLLVAQHGDQNLYVLVGGSLVDTGKNFNDNDIETLTTACPEEPPTGSLKVTKVVDSGSAAPHEFGFRLDAGDPYVYPASSSNFVIFDSLAEGSYTVTENLVANYEQVSTTCNNVAVVSGQQATCEIHNRIVEQLYCAIDIVKSHDRETAQPGDTITYRLDFQNVGTGNCTGGGVKVKDVLDSHLTYVTDSEQHSGNVAFGYGATPGHQNGTLTWNAQTLTPGESGWVTFQGTIGQISDCQEVPIPNQGKIWSNETSWLNSNTVTTLVTAQCPEAPELTVIKHVIGGGAAAGDFTMHVDGQSFPGSEGGTTRTLDPGDYVVTETGPAGFTLTYSGDCDSTGHVSLANDEQKTCTLTNTRIPENPELTVVKHVVGGGASANDFTMHVGGQSFPGNESGTTRTLDPGDYTVTETGPAGYTLTYGGDCDGEGHVSLAYDEEKTCVLTNTRDTGTIVVNKFFDDNGDGETDRFNPVGWTWDIEGGSQNNPGGASRVVPVGSVTVSEDPIPGYSSRWECSNDDPGPGTSFTVPIANNEVLFCDFFNTRETGSLTVNKKVDTDGNGSFESGNSVANTLGFRWGLDGGTLDRMMGSTAPDLPTGAHSVSENSVAGYHFVGWYDPSNEGYSCTNPQSTELPADLTVTKDYERTIVLCNALNPPDQGRVRIVKVLTDESSPEAWTFDISGYGSVNHDEWVTLDIGTYAVTEYGPADYSLVDVSGICELDEGGGIQLQVTSDGGTCTLVNSRDTGTLVVNKLVDADGNGTFEAGNAEANPLGFRWGLDAEGPTREMGVSVTGVTTGAHVVTENAVPGYHFVGWFPSGSTQFSCGNPQSNALPAPVNVTKNATTAITLCNVRDATVIGLTKTAPATVAPGGDITYTLTWSVGGTVAATNAIITDPLPANTTFVSASCGSTVGTCVIDSATSTISWSLGTRSPGESGTVTLTVRAATPLTNGTVITNTGTFDTSETDPVSAIAQTTVQSGPSIAIAKADTPDPVAAGSNITYTISWAIAGNAPATNVVVTDPLPANTTFVSADSGGTLSGGIVTWNLGTKNPGQGGVLMLVVKTAAPIPNGTVVTNTATIDSTENPPQSAVATTTITSAPSLSITKTSNVTTFANPGQTVTYTITVANAASATDTARSVVVTDTLPAGFAFDDGTTTRTFTVGDLAPGTSQVITVSALVKTDTPAGTYTNTAKGKGSNTPEVTATAPVEVRVPQIAAAVAEPKLTIEKSAKSTLINPGGRLRYEVLVKNVGEATAINTTVNDTLPAGFRFADGGGRTKTFLLGDLKPGQSFLLTYDVKVARDVRAGSYTNTATAKADNADPVSDTATVKVRTVKVLAATGASVTDYLLTLLAASLVLGSILLIRRARLEDDVLSL